MSAHGIPAPGDQELRERLAALSEAIDCPQLSTATRSKIKEIHQWLASAGCGGPPGAGCSPEVKAECERYPRCSCIVKLDGSWDGCRDIAAKKRQGGQQ